MKSDQRIGFCQVGGGRRMAYSILGQGPPMLCDTGWVNHLEQTWRWPALRRFFEVLARERTVIRFDKPGCGLADRDGFDATLAGDLAVLESLIDHLQLTDIDLFGASQAGPAMIALAAKAPERVSRLVLFGTYAKGADIAPVPVRESLLGIVRNNWGLGSETMADLFIAGADQEAKDRFAAMQRAAASADTAATFLAACYDVDVTSLLARVAGPTLVLHRRDDRGVRYELGRAVAAGIPGARLVTLEGQAHLFYVGDADAVLAPVLDFIGADTRGATATFALTDRERQVAGMVSRGLTNAEIAHELGVAPRTAEAHVEHIRNKLGVRSRAQVASWVAQNLQPNK